MFVKNLFNYDQSQIAHILEQVIANNKIFSEETMSRLKEAQAYLELNQVYLHRIEHLLNGDDNEERFNTYLKQDLEGVKK
jgi:hypothetical protein